jgi:hypothetical protein
MTDAAQKSDLVSQSHRIARPRNLAWRCIVAVAVLALVVLGVAACGGGSSASSASSTSTTTAPAGGSGPSGASGGFLQQAVKYAQCMRSHGVANFPDPDPNGGAMPINPPGVDTTSATYKAALAACKQYLTPEGSNPNQQTGAQNQQLKFAQCMRAHGITDFPDPSTSTGQQTLPSDIDPNSSAFQAANKACSSLLDAGSSSDG